MNTIKPICLSAIALVVLVRNTKQVASYTAMTAISAPLNIKKSSPKGIELKRWSHLDIVNDTIPE
jgi:hypothetical protein